MAGKFLSFEGIDGSGKSTQARALAEALRARFGLVESDTGPVVSERLDAGLAEFIERNAKYARLDV